MDSLAPTKAYADFDVATDGSLHPAGGEVPMLPVAEISKMLG